jgi:hypothetical protein
VISLEDWALIHRLVADGVPQRQVARDLRVGRATVARAVASDRPLKYERPPVPTAFALFEARVRAILSEHPEMPATVIAERVGWEGSITWFRDNLRRLRPEHRKPDPADRLTWAAGDAAQCDLWFPPCKIPLEDGSGGAVAGAGGHPCLLAVHARPDDPDPADRGPAAGDVVLLRQRGRVPRRLIWDNEPGIGRGKRHADGVAAFTGTLATSLGRLPPQDSESKGHRGATQRFVRDLLHAGPRLTCPADFNSQFGDWLTRANARMVRTIKARPADLLDADRAGMLPLPPVAPQLHWHNRVRLGRYCYVRLDACDHSVDPNAIGQLVEVTADLEQVRVHADGRLGRIRPGLGTRHDVTDPLMSPPRSCCARSSASPRPVQLTKRHPTRSRGWFGI